MSVNRIQKLLFSEYCDFEDMVLVESPFAQTTRDGEGLRQVQLGLTPSKLVLATDIIPLAKDSIVTYLPGIDPEIETFELISVFPIECVNLSVFHRRKRQSLKARFCNNKILYFELGGFEKRRMFWNLWCEKVKFLNPETNSTHSETSVATSTTNSTMYLVSSKRTGKTQFWCQYASGDFIRPPTWTNKYLYLGKNLEDIGKYTPLTQPITIEEFVKPKLNKVRRIQEEQLQQESRGNVRINRFQHGVTENCSTALFLPLNDEINSRNHLEPYDSFDDFSLCKINNEKIINISELADNAVRLWEIYKTSTSGLSLRAKHRRRYAFAPLPHFLDGLGPWNVNQGERFSLQMKRAVSVVAIKRQPIEPELRLSVSRRQLLASISCDALYKNDKLSNSMHKTIRLPPQKPVIFFWTPEYWYRPRSAYDAYHELQNHLKNINHYHQIKDRSKQKRIKVHLTNDSDSELEIVLRQKSKSRKKYLEERKFNKSKETSLKFLKRILRIEAVMSPWDFDSTILAEQLTLIVKELFLKITPDELGVLIWQQSSKNSPNIGALIAFSHRISCLVVTEILRDGSTKIRARLVARFINIADKCNKIANFQSCKSILSGLQSPPIYRLYSLWNYIRKRHSTKYQNFENLCRIYKDPRLPIYQKTFGAVKNSPPYIPYIGELIAKLLGKIPHIPCNHLSSDIHTTSQNTNMPSFFRKCLTTLKLTEKQKCDSNLLDVKPPDCKCLADYYEPIGDNRKECLKKCMELLEIYQKAANNYCYTKNEAAREYLLKARYREDLENFIYSFHIEPPRKLYN